jgi:hypothetical protein
MNWSLLVGQFCLKISIYMCFVVFGESLKTSLQVLLPRPNLYHMQIFTVISSRMNFFTNLQLPYMLLCCPHPALHHLLLLRSARPLAILAAAGAASTVAGVPTSPAAEETSLLAPDLITAASRTPPSVTVGRAHGRALGSAIGGKIHAANCVKISATQLPIVLNSNSEVMANNLLPIWCSAISPQPVLLIGFRIPVPINTSHLILPP